jgi:site-specific DNA recombinase
MRVIGYVRVSTEDQAKEGISIEMQAKKIEAYAVVKDWQLVEIITDAGYSAGSLHRPGLQRLMAMVKPGKIEAIIVYKLDRLTRSVMDLGELMKVFERKDVALVSLQESLDATTATGRLMMNLLASVSQWEREVIGERTRDAMQHLKRQGRVYSRPVFSDPDIIAWMQTARAAGKSYEVIADQLNADGIPSARGGRWQGNTVRGILRRATPCRQRRVA